ncbi:MAG: DsbA family protein [Enterococcus sp.]
MIEIYLFVNPLGSSCFHMEKDLLQFIKKEYKQKKILFRFLPLVNLQTIGDVLQERGISKKNIKEQNDLFSATYSAALDYKAALLQGKKKGREFLLQIQNEVGCKKKTYTKELSEKIIQQIGGDLPMFKEDRTSDLVKEGFYSDQKIAREMGITKHPSAVVYNYACDRDFGVLVEDISDIHCIQELCQTSETSYKVFHSGTTLHMKNEKKVQHTHGNIHLLSDQLTNAH